MTSQTRSLMQSDDSIDTLTIQRVKRLFWDCENLRREFGGEVLAGIDELQESCVDLTEILLDDAKTNHRKPVNVTNPRTPLPMPNEGKLRNGELMRATRELSQGVTHGR